MALPATATIAFCSQCRAPIKPHPFDPSYRAATQETICVLCGEGEDHPVHKEPAGGW